jgi:hypothetical protein
MLLVGLALFLMGAAVSAQTVITWTGGTDVNWSTASNWSGSNVPNSSTERANFTGGATTFDPTFDIKTGVTIDSLFISNTSHAWNIGVAGAANQNDYYIVTVILQGRDGPA